MYEKATNTSTGQSRGNSVTIRWHAFGLSEAESGPAKP